MNKPITPEEMYELFKDWTEHGVLYATTSADHPYRRNDQRIVHASMEREMATTLKLLGYTDAMLIWEDIEKLYS